MSAFLFSPMDRFTRHRELIVRGAALVSLINAWTWLRSRRMMSSRRGISYGPMTARDQERAANLRFIYHSQDVHCVELLRMRRAPFSNSAICFAAGLCLGKVLTIQLKNKLPYFC
jgi:hypothetical protein